MKKTLIAAALAVSLSAVAVACNNDEATPAPSEAPAVGAVESMAAEAEATVEAVESMAAEAEATVEAAVEEAVESPAA